MIPLRIGTEGCDRLARVQLLEELEIMKKICHHPNVVKLLGYCVATGISFSTCPLFQIKSTYAFIISVK